MPADDVERKYHCLHTCEMLVLLHYYLNVLYIPKLYEILETVLFFMKEHEKRDGLFLIMNRESGRFHENVESLCL